MRENSLLGWRAANDFQRIAMLSFEQQQKIIEAIFNDRNNDTVSSDDFGLTACQVILADAKMKTYVKNMQQN